LVSAAFDSFFPVSGDIALNDGTLSLSRNLILKDISKMKSLGDITGNGMILDLSQTVTSFPYDGNANVTFSDVTIFLRGDVFVNESHITFSGDSIINGRGNALSLSSSSSLIIDENSCLKFEDIVIKNVSSSKISCVNDSSAIEFRDVLWVQDGDYIFSAGKFDLLGDFHICGEGYKFVYQTDQVSTVSANSAIIFDNNVTFSYDPAVASSDLIVLSDDTSEFILCGATLHATSTGLRLKKGKLVIDGKSFISCDGQIEDDAISFGDGSSAENNLEIQFLPAANLEIIKGFVAYNNVTS